MLEFGPQTRTFFQTLGDGGPAWGKIEYVANRGGKGNMAIGRSSGVSGSRSSPFSPLLRIIPWISTATIMRSRSDEIARVRDNDPGW